MQILNKLSLLFELYSHSDEVLFQHKALNYFTLKAPTQHAHDTECKVIEHTLIHFSGGLRSFGRGASGHGRLGLGDENRRAEPTICTALMKKKIIKLASYSLHSLCIDANGCVYS
eukprot:1005164_1